MEFNNLNSLASYFPLVIQKLLLFLPVSDLKSIRQCTESLKHVVDQYIWLNLTLSESEADCALNTNVQFITSEMINSFKTFGIRSLTVKKILSTTFSDLFTFPYLLQRLHVDGPFGAENLIKIIKECWNIQELKFSERNKSNKLIIGDLVSFMQASGVHDRNIQLNNLKTIFITCQTTETMGYLLVLLSMIETKSLQKLHCSFSDIHRIFHTFITGILLNLMDGAASTLKHFSLIVQVGTSGPNAEALKLLNDLEIFGDVSPDLLVNFQDVVRNISVEEEELAQWLKDMMEYLGNKITLNFLRLEMNFIKNFENEWLHFTKTQKNLEQMWIQACYPCSLVHDVVKTNEPQLVKLGLDMEFSTVMDLEGVLGRCPQLKFLFLGNYVQHGVLNLEMRRSGHIINAKFDEILPNLEGLVLSQVLVRCEDIARLNNLEDLKSIKYYLIGVNPIARAMDPSDLFGVTFEDFKDMLFRRNLDHLVISKGAIVFHGSVNKMERDEEALTNLLGEAIFQTSNFSGVNL